MQKLFLDIDDTFLDTEKYCRKLLQSDGLNVSKNKSSYFYRYEDCYSEVIEKALSNYFLIPKKIGSEECLRILNTEFEIIFCSSYYSEAEKLAKQKLAKSLEKPIILCPNSKKSVDMRGGIFVDDDIDNLIDSSASKKVCFYNKYNFVSSKGYTYKGDVVFDWFELVDLLLGGVQDERLREYICKRVPSKCKGAGV